MSDEGHRRVLSAIMEYIHTEGYEDADDYSSKLSGLYLMLLKRDRSKENLMQDFLDSAAGIRTHFFRRNGIKKHNFLCEIYAKLERNRLGEYVPLSGYNIAKEFSSTYLEISNPPEFESIRDAILNKTEGIPYPHEALVKKFSVLLQKIARSSQQKLHGTKEYSGVDIVKKIGEASIGFQIKSINDDISEDKIRAQTSKAIDWNLDGFIWVYGCPNSKRVETSIQAAFHHFKRVNINEKTYCSLLNPTTLAELFRVYEIEI